MSCLYAEQVEKFEKTVLGSITKNHIYIGRNTDDKARQHNKEKGTIRKVYVNNISIV